MRMWMLPPEKMCNQHIRGEHHELHYVLGHAESGNWNVIRGSAREGYIYLPWIRGRHAELEAAGGWDSPLPEIELPALGEPIDRDRARADLLNRCGDCYERWLR